LTSTGERCKNTVSADALAATAQKKKGSVEFQVG
jgi:hypothetical protein